MMAGMPEFEHIIEANEDYARTGFTSTAGLTAAPKRHLAIVTCMDARIDLFKVLGLAVGDAHLIRNGGARATEDALRSLAVSAHFLGTREFGLIGHTRCGLSGVTDDAVRATIEENTGQSAEGFTPLAFDDVREMVRGDVERVAQYRLLPADATVWGAVYDVETGKLEVVVEPRPVEAAAASR
jgi:carbonic anhydrase